MYCPSSRSISIFVHLFLHQYLPSYHLSLSIYPSIQQYLFIHSMCTLISIHLSRLVHQCLSIHPAISIHPFNVYINIYPSIPLSPSVSIHPSSNIYSSIQCTLISIHLSRLVHQCLSLIYLSISIYLFIPLSLIIYSQYLSICSFVHIFHRR